MSCVSRSSSRGYSLGTVASHLFLVTSVRLASRLTEELGVGVQHGLVGHAGHLLVAVPYEQPELAVIELCDPSTYVR